MEEGPVAPYSSDCVEVLKVLHTKQRRAQSVSELGGEKSGTRSGGRKDGKGGGSKRQENTLNARLDSPCAVMELARSSTDRARACRARHLPENHRTSRGGEGELS